MRCFKRFGRKGLTLLEVMAGIALLSSLLVGVLLSFGGLSEQENRASRLSQAVLVADDMLAAWHESDSGVPIEQRGVVEATSFVWRTSVVNDELLPLGVVVVRLTIDDTHFDDTELLSVDVLVPVSETGPNVEPEEA